MSPRIPEVWKAIEAATDVPVTEWYNTAHESCDRWATDPERVAIVFRREDGTRDAWTYRRLSGYNVGPTEVETVILADPEVEDAAVVAAVDEARGHIVRAVIVAKSGVDQAALTKRLQDNVEIAVGRHAYPRIVDYVTALPRTESGKVKRSELRRS